MRKLIIAGVIGVLAACATPSFTPKTQAGAACKVDCAQRMTACRGSSYTCDRAAATCMAACKDLDAVSH